MAKGNDIVVLADVRSRRTAARLIHTAIVEIKPISPRKTCEVLMFSGRTRMTSAIKP
jgi:hypothetical protein